MIEAWRITKANHAASAFTGEGAAKFGGRWNSRGVYIVYTSGSKSLATLENLVHLNPPIAFKYVIFQMRFEKSLVEKIPTHKLPNDWRAEPPPPSTKTIGDTWIKNPRSAVLAVPSVITGELNYLLNPAHPNFTKIKITPPEPFLFAPRLLL